MKPTQVLVPSESSPASRITAGLPSPRHSYESRYPPTSTLPLPKGGAGEPLSACSRPRTCSHDGSATRTAANAVARRTNGTPRILLRLLRSGGEGPLKAKVGAQSPTPNSFLYFGGESYGWCPWAPSWIDRVIADTPRLPIPTVVGTKRWDVLVELRAHPDQYQRSTAAWIFRLMEMAQTRISTPSGLS